MRFNRLIFLAAAGLFLLTSCRSREAWNEIFKKKGTQYLNRGEYEDAIDEFEKAQKIFPQDHTVFLLKTEAYFLLQKWGPVIECLNTYMGQGIEMPAKYFFMRAQALEHFYGLSQDVFDGGYNPAIEKDPLNGLYYYQRGLAYLRMGDKNSSELDFQSAKRLGYSAGAA